MQDGDARATGGPAATDGDPSTTGDDPAATGGDPAATGGDPTATGDDPATTAGDLTATGVTQSSHSCSSVLTQAPDIAPLLKKFTSFSYQIASGMVSIGLVM